MNTDEISGLMTQTELLSRLVNDLHVLAQAEAKQLHLDLELVDLGVLLTRAVQSFRSMIESHELKLVMNVPVTAETADESLVQGDANRLEQIINNLLNNAVTHTPPGGEIKIDLWHDSEKVYFSIADTGNGIPANHLPHIFDRFYRADRSRSRATGGAGLGLAIVRAMVEMHSGSVRVMSEGIPGRGAVFTVEFPLARVPELPHNV
jgi:signal transduction histidine kinase